MPLSSRLVRDNCTKAVLQVLIVVERWPAGMSDNRNCYWGTHEVCRLGNSSIMDNGDINCSGCVVC